MKTFFEIFVYNHSDELFVAVEGHTETRAQANDPMTALARLVTALRINQGADIEDAEVDF